MVIARIACLCSSDTATGPAARPPPRQSRREGRTVSGLPVEPGHRRPSPRCAWGSCALRFPHRARTVASLPGRKGAGTFLRAADPPNRGMRRIRADKEFRSGAGAGRRGQVEACGGARSAFHAHLESSGWCAPRPWRPSANALPAGRRHEVRPGRIQVRPLPDQGRPGIGGPGGRARI